MMMYVLGAAGVAVLIVGGIATVQTKRLETARIENTVARGQLNTCAGRLTNVLEDIGSDNAIDALTDDDLRNVPAGWLLPGSPADP